MKKETEPKLKFNRGNPDSPVPPGMDDHDLTVDEEKQIPKEESNEDENKDGRKKKINENKAQDIERLTF